MIAGVDPLQVVVVVLLAGILATLAAMTFYLRRIRSLQREIGEMIMMGVNLDPWAAEDR